MTASPFFLNPIVVNLAVCGIMLTEKLSAVQLLIVKLMPSTATEPLTII